MIQLHDLTKSFGAKTVLHNVHLRIQKGEFVFVTGPSGAGKTTLLRLIFGSEKPERGYVLINAINLNRIKRNKLDLLRRRIGFVFQDFKLLAQRTVFQNVALALEVTGERGRLIRKKTHQALRLVGLADKESAYPLTLSGGEKQRVAIARAIVKDPLILLADEPTGNLDPDLSREIMDLFERIHRRGATVVVATHNQTVLETTTRRVILLSHGGVAFDTQAEGESGMRRDAGFFQG